MKLPDGVYDVLKWLVCLLIPAAVSCYVGLAAIWQFPYPQQIAETSAVICTFLGAILGISTSNYYKNK